MRNRFVPLVLFSGLVLSSCAGVTRDGEDPVPPTTRRPPASSSPVRVQATTTVLQAGPNEPAKLCLGGIAESLPPQCGDVPVPNWDWDAVDGETRMSGVIWGEYHVVGTFDGQTFTLDQAGPPRPRDPSSGSAIDAPCPEPDGGWTASDPARTSEPDLQAALERARNAPDAAGQWVDQPPTEEPLGPDELILIAAYTGDPEAHRAELEEVWGGPLCLWRHERTEARLLEIQQELHETTGPELGLTILFSSPDVVRNVVELGVVLSDDATQAALDERYGEGVVVLSSALQPAD